MNPFDSTEDVGTNTISQKLRKLNTVQEKNMNNLDEFKLEVYLDPKIVLY